MNIEWICNKAGISIEEYNKNHRYLLIQPFFSISHMNIPDEAKDELLKNQVRKLKKAIHILKVKEMW